MYEVPFMRFIILLTIVFNSCTKKVDLSDLFSDPTDQEKKQVLANWSQRDVSVKEWNIISSQLWQGYKVDLVSQEVNGYLHYSLVRYPLNHTKDETYGLLMLNHGGVNGCTLHILEDYNQKSYSRYFIIVPSYIGETLDTKELGKGILTSGGTKSIFDKDIDNVIALLNGILENYSTINEEQICVYGESRGACVAYLAAIRDPRFTSAMFCYGSTDHLTYPNLQQLIYSRHKKDVLPWVARFTAVDDFINGDILLSEGRLKLLQKSPIHFTERLPKQIEIHHGAKDKVVYVENSRRISSLLSNDTSMVYFKYYEYKKGGHGENMPEFQYRKKRFFSYPEN